MRRSCSLRLWLGRALPPFEIYLGTLPPFIIPLSLSIPPDGLVIQPLKRVYLAQK